MKQATIVDYLQQMIDEVAYLKVDPDQPLVVESLVAAQIKWRVDLDLDVDLPLENYLRGLTPRELADLIGAGTPSGDGGAEPPSP